MSTIVVMLLILLAVAGFLFYRELKTKNALIWLRSYLKGDWREDSPAGATRHLLFCFVDHFEPQFQRPTYETEVARVTRWRRNLPILCDGILDADGRVPIHTFFYPEEEYRPEHLAPLVELCRLGLGEIEIHLHHDNDTADGLRAKLRRFCKTLVSAHDALPIDPVTGQARWAFIHGNWALDNSRPDGRWCGVDNELPVLREEGCYADFTLPAAPDACQTRTVNRIYYATGKPGGRKAHDTGVPVEVGKPASGDVMIIQGPIGFMWHSRKFGLIPRIENADLRTTSPPSNARIDTWVNTGIHVVGKPEWTFVKVHTHGAPERDNDTLLGPKMRGAYEHLVSRYNDGVKWKLHFVSAREMYNIAKAAEAGKTGDPNAYRDFDVPRPLYRETK